MTAGGDGVIQSKGKSLLRRPIDVTTDARVYADGHSFGGR